MRWIGTTVPNSIVTGQSLKDNGIAIIDERNILFALSEERLSRIKHDHRHDATWRYCVERGIVETGVRIGISSCIDPVDAPKVPSFGVEPRDVASVPSHHYSHALLSFTLSSFSRALVLVMDAGGNTFPSSGVDARCWWAVCREQTTLWMAEDQHLRLVDRLHFEPFDTGFGEWFRAVTHYLGWHSHTLSGNTMALAAFGEARRISSGNMFDIADDLRMENDPIKPIEMVDSLIRRLGVKSLSPREPNGIITGAHADLAAFLQSSLEQSVLRNITEWIQQYDCENICLSGGVAQNCVLAAKVASLIGPGRVYVSPFSGDAGQCLGNAIHARNCDLPGAPRIGLSDTYLGTDYTEQEIERTIAAYGLRYQRMERSEWADLLGYKLATGNVVAVASGRDEFGPRALGNRSVLGDPQNSEVVRRIIRSVKRRADFMPLAPIISPSMATALADVPLSETMVFAPTIPEVFRRELGACCHVDGTARVQVFSNESSSASGFLLNAFERYSGRRALVNTSFNKRGDPMVSSPLDALSAFVSLDVDFLLLGNCLISANENMLPRNRTAPYTGSDVVTGLPSASEFR